MTKRRFFLPLCVLFFWVGTPSPRSAQAQQVCRITALGAMVLPTRFNGRCWDIGCFGKKKKKLQKFSQFLQHVKDLISWKMVLAKKTFQFASTGTYLPDAFAIVKVNGMEVLRTKRSPNTLLPMWGDSAQIPMSPKDTLEIYVYDWDRVTSNDPMGFYASVGIPRKYFKHGGILKLRFGRVQEFHLMIKPLQGPKSLQARRAPRRVRPKIRVSPETGMAIVRIRPPVRKPVLRKKPGTRTAMRVLPRARPLPRLFLPPMARRVTLTRPKPKLRVILVDPPRLKLPLRLVIVRPKPRPRIKPSPLVVMTKQAMGSYDLDKAKMLKMAKFLETNLHKLPKAKQPSIKQTIRMIHGMKMSLALRNHQVALFTSVHRFPKHTVTRHYRGTWSWHVLGKLLSLHLAEQGLPGKAKATSKEMTVFCRYLKTVLSCTNIHGRNHKYRFQRNSR